MDEKSKCIVLNTVAYKDNASIVHLYSEKLGRISCFLNTTRSKKATVKASLFQPLSILELEIHIKSGKEIHQIKEAKTAIPLFHIYTHPIKSALAMFIAEFLFRFIREQERNTPLFDFIESSIHILEWKESAIGNFHLVFLLRFTNFLGLFPHDASYRNKYFFDLQNGIFIPQKPLHGHYLQQEQSEALSKLLRINFENMHYFRYNKEQRNEIINEILHYYRLHLSDFQAIKSLDILKTLF